MDSVHRQDSHLAPPNLETVKPTKKPQLPFMRNAEVSFILTGHDPHSLPPAHPSRMVLWRCSMATREKS